MCGFERGVVLYSKAMTPYLLLTEPDSCSGRQFWHRFSKHRPPVFPCSIVAVVGSTCLFSGRRSVRGPKGRMSGLSVSPLHV